MKNAVLKLIAILMAVLTLSQPGFADSLPAEVDAPTTATLSYGYTAEWTPFQLGVVSYYQLFAENADVRGVSLGFLSTWSNDVSGVALSPLYNWGHRFRGIQLSGIVNVSDRPDSVKGKDDDGRQRRSAGLRLAGIANDGGNGTTVDVAGIYNSGNARKGLQLAGLVNATKSWDGVQLAGLHSSALGNARGLQMAGINTYASSLEGVQIAASFNYVGEGKKDEVAATGTRFQLSAIANIAQRPGRGLMATLIYNNAAERFAGLQAGGFNKTGKMSGVQFGVINDAADLQGVQLGIFNFEQGRLRLPLINVSGLF